MQNDNTEIIKILFYHQNKAQSLHTFNLSLCFLCLQDKVASESLPLQGFTVKLSDRSEGEDKDNVFLLYHKKTLYYTFRADDQHTARRYDTQESSCTPLHCSIPFEILRIMIKKWTVILQVGKCNGRGHSVIVSSYLPRRQQDSGQDSPDSWTHYRLKPMTSESPVPEKPAESHH